MRVLVAADKFKGTIAATDVVDAIARGIEDGGHDADRCPIADGGEGTASVLMGALGGEWREADATDPLGRPLRCHFALIGDGETAVVEVAEASGLWRVAEEDRDPVGSTSRGTGELIAAAARAGAGRVLLACGGSATTDGGLGALGEFDPTEVAITCLCDTDVAFPFAASVYGPQKGAGPEEVRELEDRLAALAGSLPHDPTRLPFTGAAGGLAGGLWAHGSRLVSGAAYVLAAIGFDQALASADLLVTGEGRLDPTSMRGKAVGEVARRARRAGVPCHAIVGASTLDGEAASAAGLESVRVAGTAAALRQAAAELART